MTERTRSAEQSPDYELADTLEITTPEQMAALLDDTRMEIVDLVLDRAATVKELSDVLGKPPGTIGHHVKSLERAGLIRIVRTKKVRAIEAKYYGRTARTYQVGDVFAKGITTAPNRFLSVATAEFAAASEIYSPHDVPFFSTLRHIRIPAERAAEWEARLTEMAMEFAEEPRGGDITFGLMMALYPTDRPHLPDAPASDGDDAR